MVDPKLEEDPVRYARDLLLEALFPATEEEANRTLRTNAYPIVAHLLEVLKADRAKIESYLQKLDAKQDTSKELAELRAVVLGTAHSPDCLCEICLPMGK